MKEYELYVPSQYNDGAEIEEGKLLALKRLLLEEFGGVTWFPQENEGFWRIGRITFRDRITILRVITEDEGRADEFLRALKPALERDFGQVEALIIRRDVEAL